ncbi:TetR/AcrR family transcriptional regulator [Cryptosporangium aurantiacum]|uniref:Transcriptional regulator, TetR family n=1 Tax=Cryptosporangium aurantiacum TaxID=134849 RepID=A0A1M7PG05_9ACTN|nr:TetR/AcrR family transcriptional regulator [Cryptosporangium aurantiacum]SHN15930.1 transcriptional regulator, TetR family [Cryptosporangium aurantiacum]
MSEGEFLRRDGYWPSSPVVGQRGAQTRARIVEAALRLFETEGFHGTSVDSIAKSAATSRATVYQYFESKEQIFVELLEECGAALSRVVRRLGPLGPTAEGFDNLHWWLGEWAWVYDKYATIFVQWTNIDAPGTSTRPLIVGYISKYNARIAERLAASDVKGMAVDDAALALISLTQRFNFFRHRHYDPLPDVEEAIDGFAVLMQLMLFPDTPPEAFAALPPSDGTARRRRASVSVVPTPATARPGTPTTALSRRATATVDEILAAGTRLLAEKGYHATGVDDLVAAAGFARATFYKYFDDKLDLLRRLSADTASAAGVLVEKLAAVDLEAGSDDALRAWLHEFVPFHRRYRGVIQIWSEGKFTDPDLLDAAVRSNAAMRDACLRLLRQVERSYALDLDVAAAVFLGVLDRLPVAAEEQGGPASDDEVVEMMLAVLRRGLLNGTVATG